MKAHLFLALIGFLISASIAILTISGLLPYNYITSLSSLFGSVWVMIFFILAMRNKTKDSYDATQNKMLFLQSRYASMGETVGNIAHQWKQPLNAISSIQNNIKATLIFQGEISKEKLLQSVETSFKLLEHLSGTIDTFYSFLTHQNGNNNNFMIADVFETIQKITEYSFENSNIKLLFESNINHMIQGDANEFTHAILNLILNAKDAFDNFQPQSPTIIIDLIEGDKICTITVSDNAGGISINPIDSIFDWHVSSKENSSGVGLYMTKNIIEKRFKGKITVKNQDNGACFKIELPYAEYSEHFDTVNQIDEKLSLEQIQRLSKKIIELEELEKTLKKWADIFEHARWAITVRIGDNNNFEITNPAFNLLYGYTTEELKTITVPDLFAPQSLDILPKIYKEAFENNYVVFEAIQKRKDGSLFPVSVELIVIKDEYGEILYHIANIWDMTEKKAAEERLRVERFAIENIQEAVFMADEHANFAYVNEEACRSLGYSKEELLAMSIGDVDPNWPKERWPEFWNSLKEEKTALIEAMHKRKNGTLFSVEVRANYFEYDGVGYNLGLVRDITERKAVQKELLLLNKALNNTNEATYIILGEQIVQVNDGACKMLGYSRAELTAMTLYDIDKDLTPEFLQELRNTTLKKNNRFERKHTTKDGHTLDVEIDTSAFEYDGVSYAFSAVRDITEQKKAHEELLLKEFALDTVNEAVFLIDGNSMFHYVNEGACKALGYTKEELLTKGVVDLDPNVSIEWWREHWKDIKGLKTILGVTEHIKKDGTTYPNEVSSNYFEYNGIGYSLAVSRDITERIRLEEQKDNERMRLFFERQLVGMAITSPTKGWLHVNDKLCDMLGYTDEELKSLTWAELTYPEDLADNVEQFKRLLKGEIEDYMLEKRFIRKDGNIVFTNLAVSCVRNDDGTVNYLLALLEDITKRKEMEASLKDANDRYIQILDNSIDVIYLLDVTLEEHFIYVDVNAAYEEITGIPRDVVIGLDVEDIEDETFRTILIDKFTTCLKAGEKTDYTADYPFPCGLRTFHSVLLPIRDENGRIVRIVGAARDITEQKELEILLEKERKCLIDAQRVAHTGSWELDINANILSWSDEIFHIFEIDKNQFAASYDAFLQLVHPEDRDAVNQTFVESLEQQTIYEIEHRLLMSDGRIKHVLERGESKYDGNGKALYTLGTIYDITERKEMENAVRALNETLEKRVEERTAELQQAVDFNKGVVNAIPDLMFEVDKEGTYLNVWAKNEELRALQKKQLLGKNISNVLSTEAASITIQAIEESDKKGLSFGKTLKIDLPQGEHWFELSSSKKTDGNFIVISRDITERKEIEKQLRFVNTAINNSSEAIYVNDKELSILYVNEGACKMLGYTYEELTSMKIYEIDVLLHVDDILNFDSELIIEKKAFFKTKHQRKNGEIIDVEIVLNPFIFNDMEVFVSVVKDITQEKNTQYALEQSQQRYKEIFENSSDSIYLLEVTEDGRFRTLDANPAFERSVGISRETLIGTYVGDISDEDTTETVLKKYRRCVEKCAITEETVELNLPIGTRKFHSTLIPIKDETGRVHRIIGLSRDITGI